VVWEIEQKSPAANYGGAMSTAGGLVFYTESSGAFAAVDAKTGKSLWHFETGAPPKSSPMTYMVNGRQYVAVAAGANVLSFALPVK
jgi:alcohol dehydrogenase (cytochrome c)